MRNGRTDKAIIGASLCAVIGAITIFPALSKASVEDRIAAAWLDQATDFRSADATGTYDIGADINADIDASYSSYLEAAEYQASEHQCLAEAVYYESRSEKRSGQEAVAEVILNRVDSRHFPDTICGVVYEGSERSTGCQFSFTCDGSMNREPYGKAWGRSRGVATMVMTGTTRPFTGGAT
ncbi:MAG: cell wall hydrolase, partial [Hyphomonadaceae bacterium]|nr:cell wall hydrolase [Hyphomonadaceae bacterium]